MLLLPEVQNCLQSSWALEQCQVVVGSGPIWGYFGNDLPPQRKKSQQCKTFFACLSQTAALLPSRLIQISWIYLFALAYVLIAPSLPHVNHMVEMKGAAWSTGALKEELLVVSATTAGKVLVFLLIPCTVHFLLLLCCAAIDSSLLPESNLNVVLRTWVVPVLGPEWEMG